MNIIIAASHKRFDSLAARLSEAPDINVIRIRSSDELTRDYMESHAPRYIFFLHWSSKVPADIWQAYECVMFHMTDLPYGRGGSPLQNLIVRGKAETKLTAFRCVEEIDAGPVYLKEDLSLCGTADEIFLRATAISEAMIKKIVSENIQPVAQSGEVTTFTRRRPADSNVAGITTLAAVYDHIRMLDGEGYPPAFLETDHFILELGRASLKDDCVLADIRIMKKGAQKNGE